MNPTRDNQYKKPPAYTITQAQQDVKYIEKQVDTLQSAQKSLEEETAQLRCDEYRALELCKMLKRRVDVLETLVLQLLMPEGKKYLSHEILTELRGDKPREL